MNTGTVTNGTAYMPGIGFDDPSLAASPAYLGTDLIGTTRRISGTSPGGTASGGTGQGGTGVSPVIHRNVLTAFGEPLAAVGSANTRYTYAGRFGYETPEQSYDPLQELGWLHVGARYYDPAVGRFMQRDPIGIAGGLNVYAYTQNNAAAFIDKDGFQTTGLVEPPSVPIDVGPRFRFPPGDRVGPFYEDPSDIRPLDCVLAPSAHLLGLPYRIDHQEPSNYCSICGKRFNGENHLHNPNEIRKAHGPTITQKLILIFLPVPYSIFSP